MVDHALNILRLVEKAQDRHFAGVQQHGGDLLLGQILAQYKRALQLFGDVSHQALGHGDRQVLAFHQGGSHQIVAAETFHNLAQGGV